MLFISHLAIASTWALSRITSVIATRSTGDIRCAEVMQKQACIKKMVTAVEGIGGNRRFILSRDEVPMYCLCCMKALSFDFGCFIAICFCSWNWAVYSLKKTTGEIGVLVWGLVFVLAKLSAWQRERTKLGWWMVAVMVKQWRREKQSEIKASVSRRLSDRFEQSSEDPRLYLRRTFTGTQDPTIASRTSISFLYKIIRLSVMKASLNVHHTFGRLCFDACITTSLPGNLTLSRLLQPARVVRVWR